MDEFEAFYLIYKTILYLKFGYWVARVDYMCNFSNRVKKVIFNKE